MAATTGSFRKRQVSFQSMFSRYCNNFEHLYLYIFKIRRNGDRFGASVAIDGDQIVVGASYSASVTSTTWDFEVGSLEGWSTTGTAFLYQPTYGDNTYLRPTYFGEDGNYKKRQKGVKSYLRGLYFVGTFEQRPGYSLDYMVPDPAYKQGNSQGDNPTGTMTSDVFIIYGTTISFLIGGGCDMYTEYVELLVDGYSVQRATGNCDEAMHKTSFDVTEYKFRAAQIRVVDASSSNWGHINVDEFTFDWLVDGCLVNGTQSRTSRPVYGGVIETPRSGAAYTFRRKEPNSLNYCLDRALCTWIQEAKMTASDKRPNAFFGSSVAVNDAAGIVAIGSPGSTLTGVYKETPAVYPFMTAAGASNAEGLQYPVNSRFARLFQDLPSYTASESGASAVWNLLDVNKIYPNARAYDQAGAVYVFTRDSAVLSGVTVVTAPHWYNTEHAKVQASDLFAMDSFGTAVSLHRQTLVATAIGQDGLSSDGGAVYVYNSGFAALSFAQVSDSDGVFNNQTYRLFIPD